MTAARVIISMTRGEAWRESEWKEALAKAGEKRASWEVDKIMFGNGKYIDDEVDLTPLYGLYIEGIVK